MSPSRTSGARYHNVTICSGDVGMLLETESTSISGWQVSGVGTHLMCVTLEGDGKCATKTKVSNLQEALLLVHQKILGFQVSDVTHHGRQQSKGVDMPASRPYIARIGHMVCRLPEKSNRSAHLCRTPWLWQCATPRHS